MHDDQFVSANFVHIYSFGLISWLDHKSRVLGFRNNAKKFAKNVILKENLYDMSKL